MKKTKQLEIKEKTRETKVKVDVISKEAKAKHSKHSILVKVHESYKRVIAICDADLIGKKFVDGNLQLDINDHFYNGSLMTEDEILQLIEDYERDDVSYNIVGEKAVQLCMQANLISPTGIRRISKVPIAMVL